MQDTQKNLYKKLLGWQGELKAKKHLKKLGYKIIGVNLKDKFAEVDILAYKNSTYYFCEVKTRSNLRFGTPAMAVDYKKQQKYRLFATRYMQINNLQENISFMVIEILKGEINIIENAF